MGLVYYRITGGNFYKCSNSETNCTKIKPIPIGYFKVIDEFQSVQYIQCDGYQCQSFSLSTLNKHCINNGDVILYDDEISICVNDENNTYNSITEPNSELIIKVEDTENILIHKIKNPFARINIYDNSIIISDFNQCKKIY